jgi:hypothetical protein
MVLASNGLSQGQFSHWPLWGQMPTIQSGFFAAHAKSIPPVLTELSTLGGDSEKFLPFWCEMKGLFCKGVMIESAT